MLTFRNDPCEQYLDFLVDYYRGLKPNIRCSWGVWARINKNLPMRIIRLNAVEVFRQ